MKIPEKKVKIGCFDYKLVFMDRIDHGDSECLGLCERDNLVIKIKKDLLNNPQRLMEVFLHECLHAIVDAYGIDLPDEEKVVGQLGTAIYAFFKENKISV